MSMWKSSLIGGVVSLAVVSGAWGADLPTTKAPPAAPAGPVGCASVQDFFMTNCPLSYWGLTFYGIVDMGVGWESHGARLNDGLISGVEELIGKNANHALWLETPGGLNQSIVGLRAKEEFAPNWYFVGDLGFAFDPYTLSSADGPKSFFENNGVPLASQSATGDSSRAGQFYNNVGFVGVSNPTYGTLSVGRVNSLTLDGVVEYDPMGASYAYSVIGWSGMTAGAGNTEDAKITTGVKYRENIGNFRIAAVYQMGGYEWNNGSQASVNGGAGADFNLGPYGKLSTDAIVAYDKGAVASSALSVAQNALHPGTLAATISDNRSLMLLGKWTYDRFMMAGGYEIIQTENPSSPELVNFTDIAGYTVVAADINNTAYFHPRYLQVSWIGGRYAFTDTINAGAAYYHYYQNSYGKVACSNSSAGTCSGTLNAVSFDVDWQFAKKFDAYAGVMFSEVYNGLSSGYLHGEDLAPTAGLRFRF